jgi:hypothetical protein
MATTLFVRLTTTPEAVEQDERFGPEAAHEVLQDADRQCQLALHHGAQGPMLLDGDLPLAVAEQLQRALDRREGAEKAMGDHRHGGVHLGKGEDGRGVGRRLGVEVHGAGPVHLEHLCAECKQSRVERRRVRAHGTRHRRVGRVRRLPQVGYLLIAVGLAALLFLGIIAIWDALSGPDEPRECYPGAGFSCPANGNKNP